MDQLFYSGFELVQVYQIRFRQQEEPEEKLAAGRGKRCEGAIKVRLRKQVMKASKGSKLEFSEKNVKIVLK